MNYSQLSKHERAILSRVLNTKRELEKATQAHQKAIAQAMELAKKSGTLEKDGEMVIYTPELFYTTLDTVKLKSEHPELMKDYAKGITRKETLKVLVK